MAESDAEPFERGNLPDHIGPLPPVTHVIAYAGEYVITWEQLRILRGDEGTR